MRLWSTTSPAQVAPRDAEKLLKSLAASSFYQKTPAQAETVYFDRPYFDQLLQRWVTLICTKSGNAKYATPMRFDNADYESSVVSCGMIDFQNFAKYKDDPVDDYFNHITDKVGMEVVDKHVLNVLNFPDQHIMRVDKYLSQNYNYSFAQFPPITSYVGVSESNLENISKPDARFNVSVTISKDPSNPSYFIKNDLFVRSKRAGFFFKTDSSGKQDLTPSTYALKYLFYFESQLLDSERSSLLSYISDSQSQITYLALIIIIIICAIVMCISFK